MPDIYGRSLYSSKNLFQFSLSHRFFFFKKLDGLPFPYTFEIWRPFSNGYLKSQRGIYDVQVQASLGRSPWAKTACMGQFTWRWPRLHIHWRWDRAFKCAELSVRASATEPRTRIEQPVVTPDKLRESLVHQPVRQSFERQKWHTVPVSESTDLTRRPHTTNPPPSMGGTPSSLGSSKKKKKHTDNSPYRSPPRVYATPPPPPPPPLTSPTSTGVTVVQTKPSDRTGGGTEEDFSRCPTTCSRRGSIVITFVVAFLLIAIIIILAVLLGS